MVHLFRDLKVVTLFEMASVPSSLLADSLCAFNIALRSDMSLGLDHLSGFVGLDIRISDKMFS